MGRDARPSEAYKSGGVVVVLGPLAVVRVQAISAVQVVLEYRWQLLAHLFITQVAVVEADTLPLVVLAVLEL